MMSTKPADLFCSCDDLDDFRDCIIKLNGQFDLETDDMVKLGEEYFKHYPDSFSNRNFDNIHTGYQLMRLCMLEKMMCDFEEPAREFFRKVFSNIKLINQEMPLFTEKEGEEQTRDYVRKLEERILDMNKLVETVPTGMVKERFVGGIAHFYNIVYLLKISVGLVDV